MVWTEAEHKIVECGVNAKAPIVLGISADELIRTLSEACTYFNE